MALAIIRLRHSPFVLLVFVSTKLNNVALHSKGFFSVESSSCGTCTNVSSHRASRGVISVKLCIVSL